MIFKSVYSVIVWVLWGMQKMLIFNIGGAISPLTHLENDVVFWGCKKFRHLDPVIQSILSIGCIRRNYQLDHNI